MSLLDWRHEDPTVTNAFRSGRLFNDVDCFRYPVSL